MVMSVPFVSAIAFGADTQRDLQEGTTTLMHAVMHDNLELVRKLVEIGGEELMLMTVPRVSEHTHHAIHLCNLTSRAGHEGLQV
jgi:hypothetical protein